MRRRQAGQMGTAYTAAERVVALYDDTNGTGD